MKPLMYRHRPAFPALIGAACSLVAGLFCVAMVYERVQIGEIGEEKLAGLVLISIAVTGICLIAAFARYQFTHLWLKPRRDRQRHR